MLRRNITVSFPQADQVVSGPVVPTAGTFAPSLIGRCRGTFYVMTKAAANVSNVATPITITVSETLPNMI
jgi:hypothetical protein